MGFNGNLTNNAKSPFVFDKIVSSRYELDTNANTDGIFLGRYVLVQYDTSITEDTVPTAYMYNNKAFMSLYFHITQSDERCYIGANYATEITQNYILSSGQLIEEGTILKIPAGQRIYNLNAKSYFVKIHNENNALTYEAASEYDYASFMNKYYPTIYSAIDLTKDNYEMNTYYVVNELGSYVLSDQPFNKDVIYYDRGLNFHLHIVNDKIQYGGTMFPPNDYIIRIPKGYSYLTNPSTEFWKAKFQESNINWQQLTDASSNFLRNFNLDFKHYQNNRGYDSTVWMKTYAAGAEKYVKIAELNVILPTIHARATAPTLIPDIPQYNLNSANTNYELTVQPQWGFRVKSANGEIRGPSLVGTNLLEQGNSQILMSSNTSSYPSDETTVWSTAYLSDTDELKYYSSHSGQWEEFDKIASNLPAAIYFNRAGFKPDEITYSNFLIDPTFIDKYNPNLDKNLFYKGDSITIAPSGFSGRHYLTSLKNNISEIVADTQELSIMLPSIGDTIASVWDLVYGDIQVNNGTRRNLDIEWRDASSAVIQHGLRLSKTSINGIDYNPAAANTLAGCINTVHDLIGMIIVNTDNLLPSADITNPSVIATLSDNYLYYNPAKKAYQYKSVEYSYKEIDYDYEQAYNVTEESFSPFMYYIKTALDTYIPATEYIEGTDYYKKLLSSSTSVEPVTLTPFAADTYYYKVSNGYVLETNSIPTDGMQYYSSVRPVGQPVTFKYRYEKNKYYVKTHKDVLGPTDGNIFTYYTLESQDIPTNQIHYLLDENLALQITNYAESKMSDGERDLCYIYLPPTGNNSSVPAFYYEKINSVTGQASYIKETRSLQEFIAANTLQPIQYYKLALKQEAGWTIDANGNLVPSDASTNADITSITPVTLIPFKKEMFYYKNRLVEINENEDIVVSSGAALTTRVAQWDVLSENKLREHYSSFADKQIDYYVFVAEEEITFRNVSDKIFTTKDDVNDLLKASAVKQCYYYDKDLDNYILISSFMITQEFIDDIAKRTIYQKDYPDFQKKYGISANDRDKLFGNMQDNPQASYAEIGNFYMPNKYYYLYGEADWILDSRPQSQDEVEYYENVSVTSINKQFYIPGKYWYNIGEKRVIDYNLHITPGRSYYNYEDIYVLEDSRNIWNQYAPFSLGGLSSIPNSVKLAKRTEQPVLKDLSGYAYNTNTLNGLILAAHKKLDIGNEQTRDLTTLQGCLNSCMDMMKFFKSYSFDKIGICGWTYGGQMQVITTDNSLQLEIGTEEWKLKHPAYHNGLQSFSSQLKGNIITLPVITIDAFGHTTLFKTNSIDLSAIEKFKELDTATQSINSIQTNIEQIRTNIATLNTQDTVLEGKITTNTNSIADIQKKNSSQDAAILALQTKDSLLEQDIADIQAVNATQNNAIQTLQIEDSNIKASISAIEIINTNQANNIKDLQAENTQIKASIAVIEIINETQTDAIADLQDEDNAIKTSISNIETINQQQDAAITALQNKDKEIDQRLAEQTNKNAEIDSNLSSILLQLEAFEQAHENFVNILSELTANNAMLTSQIENLTSQIEVLETKIVELESAQNDSAEESNQD